MYYISRVNPIDLDKVAHPYSGSQVIGGPMPSADYLEISPNPPGPDVIMAGYTDDEWFSGDSWHPTLSDAKAEALRIYGVPLDAWEEVSELKLRNQPPSDT